MGKVGDVAPASTNEPTIQFDVGYALNDVVQLTHCNIDNTDCY